MEGGHSVLLTTATMPWVQFGKKVPAGQVGQTYTLDVSVKALGDPVTARLEVERAGRPWDRAVRGDDVGRHGEADASALDAQPAGLLPAHELAEDLFPLPPGNSACC